MVVKHKISCVLDAVETMFKMEFRLFYIYLDSGKVSNLQPEYKI